MAVTMQTPRYHDAVQVFDEAQHVLEHARGAVAEAVSINRSELQEMHGFFREATRGEQFAGVVADILGALKQWTQATQPFLESVRQLQRCARPMPRAGDVLPNGATVLQARDARAGLGQVPGWFVLALSGSAKNTAQPLVTWWCSEEHWQCSGGHYYLDGEMAEALADFGRRR